MREKRAGFLMLCVHDFDLRGCFRIVRMIVIVYGKAHDPFILTMR